MEAEVIIINKKRGMVAALTEDGEYVVFELLGSYALEINDVVSHPDFYSMGGKVYRNLSKDENMDVFVENVCATLDQAKKQCFL